MDFIKRIWGAKCFFFSHYTRLEPGTNERKNKKTEQCFITKSQAEWFLEKYLPSSTYYLERREKKMIAPLLLACAKW